MNERETFQQDQAEAESRDQQAWEANIARAQMEVASTAMHAEVLKHKAQAWAAVGSLVTVLWVLTALYGLAFLAHLITGKGF